MRVERERPKVRAYEKNGGMNMSCDSRSRLTWPYKGHSIHDQHSDIRFAQSLLRFFHTQFAKFALIIKPRRINDDHRPERQQFH